MTEEQRRLVEENHNLIYFYLHKRGLAIEEFYGLAAIGLCKAAMTYKDDVSKFNTYAMRCISNEVNMYLRRYYSTKVIPDDLVVSLHDYAVCDDKGKCKTYEELQADTVNIEDEVIAKIYVENMLASLSDMERKILSLRMDALSQMEIAERLGVSQAQVSIILRKLKERVISGV